MGIMQSIMHSGVAVFTLSAKTFKLVHCVIGENKEHVFMVNNELPVELSQTIDHRTLELCDNKVELESHVIPGQGLKVM